MGVTGSSNLRATFTGMGLTINQAPVSTRILIRGTALLVGNLAMLFPLSKNVLPWEDGDETPTQNQNLPSNLKKPTFDQAKQRAYTLLDSQRTDRIMVLSDCLAFWEAYDMILWRVEEAGEDESVALTSMIKLKEKILERIKQRVKDGGVTEITGQR